MNVLVFSFTLILLILSENTSTKTYFVHQDRNVLHIPCMSDNDCKADAPGTRCIGGLCTSTDFSGYRQLEVSQVVRKIGENCRRSSDCMIERSVCDERDMCACKNGTIPSENGKTCLLAATSLGQSCEENIQCSSSINFTECAGGVCSCVNHMRGISGECFHMKGLRERCANDEECWNVKHSICSRDRCACVKKYVAGSSTCLIVAQGISAACTEDVQCTASLGKGAECVAGFCDCKELYQYKSSSNKCVMDRMLGEQCSDHQDCHQPEKAPSRLECLLGECKCREPYYEIRGYCAEGSSGTKQISALTAFLIIVLFCV